MIEPVRHEYSSESKRLKTTQNRKRQRQGWAGGLFRIMLFSLLIGSPGLAQNRERPAPESEAFRCSQDPGLSIDTVAIVYAGRTARNAGGTGDIARPDYPGVLR